MKNTKAAFIVLTFFFTLTCCYRVMFAQRVNDTHIEEQKDIVTGLEKEIEVTAEKLNLRCGAGLEYPVIGVISKGEKARVMGKLGEWYIVYAENGMVGAVSSDFTMVTKLTDAYIPMGDGEQDLTPSESTKEQQELFELINNYRRENRRRILVYDEKLNKIAQLKAQDMVKNNYFGHNSRAYGTPFNMLKQMGVIFKSASENIVYSNNINAAHEKTVGNLTQRVNILNERYSRAGIGVFDSKSYGKIIVEIFIED